MFTQIQTQLEFLCKALPHGGVDFYLINFCKVQKNVKSRTTIPK
jgi:hypothetical protein